MKTVYTYVLDTMADWELGHITSELNSGRFFKKDAPQISCETVGQSQEPIKTMGGLTVVPDCSIDDIVVSEASMLLLPGADTWSDPKHSAILEKAKEILAAGGTVGAICGATVALAGCGILDDRPHTSNGPGFLEMLAPGYQGEELYVDTPSVSNGNLITANPTASLMWAKQIIEHLDVFQPDTLESWYAYFSSGDANHFYSLMQTLSTE